MGFHIINADLLESNADAILHQVNCKGIMGSGLAKQIRNKYPTVYDEYVSLCKQHKDDTKSLLGFIQGVHINEKQDIVNLFAQDGYGKDKQYTDYNALRKCLKLVNSYYKGKVIGLPYKMGCGLGGGRWIDVASIIVEELTQCEVFIYRLL